MNAQFDVVISKPGAAQGSALAASCCPRHCPATDQGPEILGLVVDVSERVARRVARGLQETLKGAAFSRQ